MIQDQEGTVTAQINRMEISALVNKHLPRQLLPRTTPETTATVAETVARHLHLRASFHCQPLPLPLPRTGRRQRQRGERLMRRRMRRWRGSRLRLLRQRCVQRRQNLPRTGRLPGARQLLPRPRSAAETTSTVAETELQELPRTTVAEVAVDTRAGRCG